MEIQPTLQMWPPLIDDWDSPLQKWWKLVPVRLQAHPPPDIIEPPWIQQKYSQYSPSIEASIYPLAMADIAIENDHL